MNADPIIPFQTPDHDKNIQDIDETFNTSDSNLSYRHKIGRVWRIIFLASTIVGIISLSALLMNIINTSFGYVAIEDKINPNTLSVEGVPLEKLPKQQLIKILSSNISKGLYRKLSTDLPFEERTEEDIYNLIMEKVVQPKIIGTWSLYVSITDQENIKKQLSRENPEARLSFISWVRPTFLREAQSSDPLKAGIRSAFLGSLWTIMITIMIAFPLGVGAAIYLEEYAVDNIFNKIIQTNINNLAGVPSIIYGMLGLAIFVRNLEPITSGTIFGVTDPTTANGRTILSAGLTLAILILPLLIINAQEAIRSVPNSLRHASYGLGATKWQTVWHHVLPNAIPGILTGTILAISRAIGETAPLVVVGASTFISFDPESPFSKFTTLPIQIYQWTSRPQSEFRNIAAAAIIVLMVMLLTLNAAAVIFRNKYSRRLT